MRCFAFDANDGSEPVDDVKRKKLEARPGVVVLPPGLDASHLAGQLEIVMHDFAASMLNVLEQKILTVSPATISLESYVDSAAFLGSGLSAVVFSTEDDASRTKRKYGRVQKAMGDYALLAGSPIDALDHYNTAVELARVASDWVYVAAALEGIVTSKLLHEAITRDAFPPPKESVFQSEGRWRADDVSFEVKDDREGDASGEGGGDDDNDDGGVDASLGLQGVRGVHGHGGTDEDEDCARSASNTGDETVGDKDHTQQSASRSVASTSAPATSSLDPFKQPRFWEMLQGCDELLEEVSNLLDECKAAIRKRSALPLLVESELRYARLLSGLKGMAARQKVCKLVSSVQRAAEILSLPEDRMVALIEAADVLGTVGATRKRVLLLWQAVELGKYFGFPEEKTLAMARRALELRDKEKPAGPGALTWTMGEEGEWDVFRNPLSQKTNIPDSWGLVKAGILEATLGLAIYANRHTDVWDAASALLREHNAILSPHRVRSLYDNLKAASLNISAADKFRPGRGPPPIVYLVGPRPLEGEREILMLEDTSLDETRRGNAGRKTSTPFLYDALASKRRESSPAADTKRRNSITKWVRGEPGRIDLELYNASPVTMKIARLVLLANVDGLPATKAQWKPKVVSLTAPPTSRPVKITLEATPLVEGEFTLIGCRMMSSEGVSWMAPWSERQLSQVQGLNNELRRSSGADDTRAHLAALPKLPMATLAVHGEMVDRLQDKRVKDRDSDDVEGTDRAAGGERDGNDVKGDDEENKGKIRESESGSLSSSSREPQSATKIRMLRGHQADCVLRFSNVSSVPVTVAKVHVSRRVHGQDAPLQHSIDAQVLKNINEEMPLVPGAVIDIPMAFTAGMVPMPVGMETGGTNFRALQDAHAYLGGRLMPDMASYDVSVEYGPPPRPKGGDGPDGAPMTLARRATCKIEVSIVPSIELSDLSVKVVYGPERCLLLAGVVNRSGCPLTAVCCALDEADPAHSRSSLCESSRGRLTVIPPGHQSLLELELTADVLDRAVIRFGSTADALHGLFELPAGAVRASLSPAVLSMLRPHNVTASISLTGDKREVGGGHGDDGLPQPKGVILGEGGAPIIVDWSSMQNKKDSSGVMPIVVTRVGEALQVAVEMKSNIDVPCTATYTVWAEPVVLKAIGGEGKAPPTHGKTSNVAILPLVQEGWERDSALDLGMAWNGVVRDALLKLPAGGSAVQHLSLSCWDPGWYKLEISDVRIHDATESKSEGRLGCVSASLSAVSAAPGTSARAFPAFLLVEPNEQI